MSVIDLSLRVLNSELTPHSRSVTVKANPKFKNIYAHNIIIHNYTIYEI